jgi:hypothetical protein
MENSHIPIKTTQILLLLLFASQIVLSNPRTLVNFEESSLTVTNLSPSSICANNPVDIIVSGSNFVDVTDVFIGTTSVGYTVDSASQITIQNINAATTGRIRVVTATDDMLSVNSLVVNSITASLNSSASGPVCEGDSVTFSATGGDEYQFLVNGVPVTGYTIASTYTSSSFSNNDEVNVNVRNSATGCVDTATAIPVLVVDLPNPLLSSDVTANCSGENITFTATDGDEYQFYINGNPHGSKSSLNTTTINSLNNGDTVSVRAFNSLDCGTTSTGITVSITDVPAAAGAISGDFTVCQGDSGIVYAVSTIAGASSYNWNLPSGASIVGVATGQSITVDYNSVALSGNISVHGVNSCGDGTSSSASVTVNIKPDAATAISGDASVDQTDVAETYTVAAINNATSYVWTLPSGASIVSGSGTNSIAVDFSNAQDGILTVKGQGVCGEGSVSPDFNVTVSPLPDDAGTLSGPSSTIYKGSSGNVFSVPTIANATTYVWTVPPGGTIVSGNGTNSITVDFSDTASNGIITVLGQNSIGQGASSSFSLTLANPPLADTGTDRAICIGDSTILGGTEVPINTYSWTSNPPDLSISDPNSQNPTVTPTVSTMYTLTETTPDGGQNSNSITVTVNQKPAVSAGADQVICLGDSVQIGSAGDPTHTYSWVSNPTGFTSSTANPTVSPTVTTTYTLTETITSTGCSESQSMTVTVEQTPVISAGADDTICENATNFILSDASGPATGVTYLWESDGDGSFDDDTLRNPTYTPGATDLGNGSVVLRMNANNTSGPCTSSTVQDDMTLSFTPNATIDAGPGTTICGTDTYQLNATATNYSSISWSSSGSPGTLSATNIEDPLYTPSAADILNGTVTLTMEVIPNSECGSTPLTDPVVITLTAPPTVDAGDNATICAGTDFTISTSSQTNTSALSWSTLGDGTFSSGGNTLAPTYRPGANDIIAGAVTLTLEGTGNGLCSSTVNDNMLLTINQDVIVDAGADGALCEGPNTLLGATATNADTLLWSHDGDGFLTNPNSLTPVYEPAGTDFNGTVTFTLTATSSAPCAANPSDTVMYSFVESPIVSAGPDLEICESGSFFISSASASNFDSIQWTSNGTGGFDDSGNTTPVYTPSAADIANGSVRLTITGNQPPCTPVTDFMVLTIVKEPTVTATTDQSICQGDQITVSAAASNYSSVNWIQIGGLGTLENPTTLTPTYISDVNDSGPVTLRVTVQPNAANGTTACGGQVTDEMVISITPSPSAEAGASATICEGETHTITTGTSASNYSTIQWNTSGDGTFTAGNTLLPTYTPGFNDKAVGLVTLSLIANPNGPCTLAAVDDMLLTITQNPVISAGDPSVDLCEDNGPFTITDATASSYDTLEWSTSGTGVFNDSTTLNPEYTPNSQDISNGQVTLTLTGKRDPTNCGAETQSTRVLNFIKNPTASAGLDATICDDSTYLLNDASALNYSNIVWISNGDGTFSNPNTPNPIYTPGPTDIANQTDITLTITAVPLVACATPASDSMILSFVQATSVDVGADRLVCEGDALVINLTDGVDATNATSFSWTTSGNGSFSNTAIINPTYTPSNDDINNGVPVTLTLTASPTVPCALDVSDSFDLTIVKNPTADAGDNIAICETGFTINDAVATDFNTLEWVLIGGGTGSIANPSTLTPTYTPSAADIASGSVTLQLTASPNNPCAVPAISTRTFTIGKEPIVFAGNPETICEGETFIVSTATVSNSSDFVWSSPTGGSFVNETTLTPTFTPSATEITAGQATLVLTAQPEAPCNAPVAKTMVLTIQNQPDVEAGPNATVCEGNTFETSGASLAHGINATWSSSSGGTFANPSSIITTYTPNATDISNGFVDLTLTADAITPCVTSLSDTRRLFITPQATVTINPDTAEICETGEYVFQPGQVTTTNDTAILWTHDGTGTFINETTLAPTYTPGTGDAALGQVTLTISVDAGLGCTNPNASDNFTLDVTPVATLDISASPLTVCLGSSITLDAIPTNYDTTSIAWIIISGTGSLANANTLNPIYTPASDSDTVRIRATVGSTNSCSETVSQEIVVQVTQLPEILTLQGNDTSCDISPYTISGTTTNGEESLLVWSTSGSGSFSNANDPNPIYTPSQADVNAGGVTLTLTANADTPCTITENDSDSFVLSLTPAATANAGAPDTVCETEAYTVTDATATESSSINWTSNTNSGTFVDADTLTPEYTPGAVDLANGFFILTMEVTGNAPCGNVTSQKRVDIIKNPTVDVGTNQDSCSNTVFSITGVNASEYSALLWTTSGTGTFSNDSLLEPDYNPSAADISAGSVILTLTASANTPCTLTDDDSFVLSFVDAVTVNAGIDQTICEDQTVSLLGTSTNQSSLSWTTSGDGGFDVTNTLNPIYTLGANDLTSGTVTLKLTANGNPPCASVEDEMIVTINKNPVINIGADFTICEGDSITVSDVTASNYNSLLWTTTGTGSLTNESTLSPTYVPAAGENAVVLTLTASAQAPCLVDDVKSKNIIIQTAASVDAGDDATLCQEDTSFTINTASTINTSSISWSAGTGTGNLINPSSLTPTYEPSLQDYVNGSVTLTLTGIGLNSCPAISDSMVLTLISSPTTNAGPNASICMGDTFTVSGAAVSNESSFEWTSTGSGSLSGINTLTPTYTPGIGEFGTVTLTLTAESISPCTETSTAQMILTIDQPVEADLGVTSDTICQGDDYNLNATADHYSSFSWSSTGSGTFVNANTLNPTYQSTAGDASLGNVTITLTAVPQGGCSSNAVSSMTLSVTKLPAVFAGNDTTLCEGDDYVLSGATISNGITPTWTTLGGDGTFNSNTLLNPTYTPGATDLSNGSVTLVLTAQPNAPCINEVSDQIELTFVKQPIANAGADVEVCEGSYTVNGATASNASSVAWSIVQGTGTLASQNTLIPTYTSGAGDSVVKLLLTANPITPCGVAATDEIELTVKPTATVDAGTNATICEGEDYTFINGATVTNAASYTWTHNGLGSISNNGTLTPTYSPSSGETGTIQFTLTATPNAPCSTLVLDTFDLEIAALAEVNAGPDVTICEGSYTLSGTVNNSTNYLWSTTNGTGTFVDASQLGTTYVPSPADIAQGFVDLTLTAQNQSPCLGEVFDSVQIRFTEAVSLTMGPDATICEGDNYVLSNTLVSNYSTISWSSNGDGIFDYSISSTNPTYEPGSNDIASGTVQITLSASGNGSCPAVSDDIDLIIIKQPEVSVGTSNLILCETNNPFTLSGVTARNHNTVEWTTSGTGTFTDETVLNPEYNPSTNDITNGVVLSVTVTGNGGCSFNAIDTVNVSFTSQVTVEAGNNAMICEDDSLIISGASTSSSSFTWSSNGDGMFVNENTLSPTYTPGITDIANGSVVVTLQATGNLPCAPSVSDNLTIDISRKAVVDAGANAEICETGNYTLSASENYTQSVTWITNGDGAFSNENVLNPTYTPGTTDISNGQVTLTLIGYDSAICGGNNSSSMVLSFIPEVIVDAGPDGNVCGNGSNFALSGASINTGSYQNIEWTTTNGTGIFLPNANVLNPEYVPSNADVINGSVNLTLTVTPNISCNTGLPISSSMQLSFDTIPTGTGTIIGSSSVCEGNSSSYTVSGYTNASSYVWNVSPSSIATISSGQGSNTVTVDYSAGGNASITVTPMSACGSGAAATTNVLVAENDEMVLSSGNSIQTSCSNSPIDPILYNVNASVTGVSSSGLPSGVTASYSGGVVTVSGTPTVSISSSQTYNYTLTTSGGSCLPTSDTGSITLDPSEEINLVTAPISNAQTLCEGGTINTIQYALGANTSGATLSWGANGAPTGISYDPATLTFSGTLTDDITSTTVYAYTLTSTGTVCPDQETGTITVNADSSIELISASGTDSQILCQNTPIDTISYRLTNAGSASIPTADLPAGVTYSISGNTLTISGTPTESGTFNYTITTSSNPGGCLSASINGSMSINAAVSVSLSSGVGSDNQEICEGDNVNITYDVGAGVSGVSVSGLPQGVSYLYASGVLTISGTSTTNLTSPKVYTYTVTTLGATCNNQVQGIIKINPDDDISLSSTVGTDSQTLCEGDAIDDIEFALTGGSSGATVTGLPTGVSYTVSGNILTISGSATDTPGSYNYTVTTSGSCGSTQATGTIVIEALTSITLISSPATSSQDVCQYSAINDIVYELDGNAVTGSVSGLPAGVSFDVVAGSTPSKKVLTISGTPTTTGVFQYEVVAVGGCGNTELGVIQVDSGAYLTLSSDIGTDDQLVCEAAAIEPIVYNIVGSASSVTATGLPPGISISFDPTTNVVELTGTYNGVPLTTDQTFNYTLFSVSSCTGQADGKITLYPTTGIEPEIYVKAISTTPTQTEVKNILCNGADDGEIFVVLSGGSASDFSIQWTGPSSYSNSSQYIKDLKEGTYTLTLKDLNNNNCEFSKSYVISEAAPLEINEIQVNPLSCNTSQIDGEIQVQVTGGSPSLSTKLKWYRLNDDESCFTYNLAPVNNDGDAIPDYADADLDENGVTDTGKADADADGIKDLADADADGDGAIDTGKADSNGDGISDSYSVGTVSYQVCEAGNTFTTINLSNSDFINGFNIICAKSNTVTSSANLDHDLDAATPDISSIDISGGINSCSAGTFQYLPSYDGSSFVSGLDMGVYKLVVTQEDRNGIQYCETEKSFELVRDAIEYGEVSVDSDLCQNTPGYLTIEITRIRGDIFFFYNDALVNQTDIEIVSSTNQKIVYSLYINSPTDNATLEIRNEFGCGVLVNQSILNLAIVEPSFTYTSPELQDYGIISERSFVEFNASNAAGYAQVEWDFDDSTSLEYGTRITHQFVQSGNYEVTMTVYNASGCSKSTTQTLLVGDGYNLIIPNVFTPNGDNINERFRPIFNGLKSIEFSVFDESGNLLYTETGAEGSNPAITGISILGWDGANAYPDTSFYIYRIEATLINEKTIVKSGTFQILK